MPASITTMGLRPVSEVVPQRLYDGDQAPAVCEVAFKELGVFGKPFGLMTMAITMSLQSLRFSLLRPNCAIVLCRCFPSK